MKVRCGEVELSIIGPGDDWQNDPVLGGFASLFEEFREKFFPDLPSTDVHGDGKNTWEVAAYDHDTRQPAMIPEWVDEYLLPPPISNEDWLVYGNVPTEVILTYIQTHNGDGGIFKSWLEQTT